MLVEGSVVRCIVVTDLKLWDLYTGLLMANKKRCRKGRMDRLRTRLTVVDKANWR